MATMSEPTGGLRNVRIICETVLPFSSFGTFYKRLSATTQSFNEMQQYHEGLDRKSKRADQQIDGQNSVDPSNLTVSVRSIQSGVQHTIA